MVSQVLKTCRGARLGCRRSYGTVSERRLSKREKVDVCCWTSDYHLLEDFREKLTSKGIPVDVIPDGLRQMKGIKVLDLKSRVAHSRCSHGK